MHEIQSSDDAAQTGVIRTLDEPSLAVVLEVLQLVHQEPAGEDHVQVSVTIEVVHDRATRMSHRIQPDIGSPIVEPPHFVLGGERPGLDQPTRGHTLWILAEKHIRDVEQPPVSRVLRVGREESLERLGRRTPRRARRTALLVQYWQ